MIPDYNLPLSLQAVSRQFSLSLWERAGVRENHSSQNVFRFKVRVVAQYQSNCRNFLFAL